MLQLAQGGNTRSAMWLHTCVYLSSALSVFLRLHTMCIPVIRFECVFKVTHMCIPVISFECVFKVTHNVYTCHPL